LKNLALLIALFILVCNVSSQTTISYDSVLTNTVSSKSFFVKNPTNKVLKITSVRTLTSRFYFNITSFNINPNDSVQVVVYFKTNQNLTYRDFLIFETSGYRQSLLFYSLATAKYSDVTYSFTQGLIDEQLKAALRSFTTTGYISLGYNTARDRMFDTIDDYNNTDTIECVYIGRKIHAANRTEAQNLGFNTEHTFPQSFFSENEPMRSDLFHLYPTDNEPNNRRSNYPFGFVVSNITWDSAGSKLGKDYASETVFEPRDVHKGNAARSIFYFCVKYIASIDTSYMSAKQENVLRQWNILDTVNARERSRNASIYSFEHVRNPFIDHPEFFDRINSCYRVSPTVLKGEISASPFNVVYDTLSVNDTASYYIAVMNYGTSGLTITSAVSDIPQFIVENVPSTIPQNEFRFIKVKFKPTSLNQTYDGILTIHNSDSTLTINLKGFSFNTIGVVNTSNEIPNDFKLFQNYPNPFNPVTNIKYQIINNSLVTLKIYDILCREVGTLVNEFQKAGTYVTQFPNNQFLDNRLPSGIYYYKLTAGNFTDVKKMIVLK
jgi:hypothetical protein